MDIRNETLELQRERKTCTVLLGLLVVLLAVLCALPADAAVREASSNGVSVTASTNKEVYVAGEAMTVEVQVTNHNEKAISDVSVEIPCPLGFQTGSQRETLVIGQMDAGETRYGSFTFIAAQSIMQNNNVSIDQSTHITVTNNTQNITNTTNNTSYTANRTENYFYRYMPEPVRRIVHAEPPVTASTYARGVNGVVRAPVVRTGDAKEALMWPITLGAGALAVIFLLVFRKKGRKTLDLLLAGAVFLAAWGGAARTEAYESGFINVSLLTNVNEADSYTEVCVSFILEDGEEEEDPAAESGGAPVEEPATDPTEEPEAVIPEEPDEEPETTVPGTYGAVEEEQAENGTEETADVSCKEPEEDLYEEPAYEEPAYEEPETTEIVTDFVDPDNQSSDDGYGYEDVYDGYYPEGCDTYDDGSLNVYAYDAYDDCSQDAYDYDTYTYDDGSQDVYSDGLYGDGSQDVYSDDLYGVVGGNAYDKSYDDGVIDAWDEGSSQAGEEDTAADFAAVSPYYMAGDPRGSIASLQASAAYMGADEAKAAMSTLLADLQNAGDIQGYCESGGSWVVTMSDGSEETVTVSPGNGEAYEDGGDNGSDDGFINCEDVYGEYGW